MTKRETSQTKQASELIDGRITELGDWRGKVLAEVRALIRKADPEIVEEWKWRGVPVWSHDGIICTGETYKQVVKLTFAKGARLKDPDQLFNSSLEGNTRRAIDIHEGEKIRTAALRALVREAVALNASDPEKTLNNPGAVRLTLPMAEPRSLRGERHSCLTAEIAYRVDTAGG